MHQAGILYTAQLQHVPAQRAQAHKGDGRESGEREVKPKAKD